MWPQGLFESSERLFMHAARLAVLALITQQVAEVCHDCDARVWRHEDVLVKGARMCWLKAQEYIRWRMCKKMCE